MPHRTFYLAAWLSVATAWAQSFACRETVERYRDRQHLDTVTATLVVVEGVERYSDIRRDGIALASLADLPGAWSMGEYSTLWVGRGWTVRLGGDVYPLRFRGRRSGLRVERRAHPQRGGVCSLEWRLTVGEFRRLTVPQEALYIVRYADHSETNRIRFSDFQGFEVRSALLCSR